MKKITVTVTQEFIVPDKFKIKILNDKMETMKVGSKFARPTISWFNWKNGGKRHVSIEPIASGVEDYELCDKLMSYMQMEDFDIKFK